MMKFYSIISQNSKEQLMEKDNVCRTRNFGVFINNDILFLFLSYRHNLKVFFYVFCVQVKSLISTLSVPNTSPLKQYQQKYKNKTATTKYRVFRFKVSFYD